MEEDKTGNPSGGHTGIRRSAFSEMEAGGSCLIVFVKEGPNEGEMKLFARDYTEADKVHKMFTICKQNTNKHKLK